MARRKFRRAFRKFRRGVRRFMGRRKGIRTARQRTVYAADRQIVRLKYTDNRSLTTALSPITQYAYRMNSPFDPDFAVGGSSVPGFSDWAAIYNRYRCYRIAYDISMVTHANTGSGFSLFAVPANENITFSGLLPALGNPYTKTAPAQISGHIARLRGRVSLPMINGRTSTQYKSSDSTQALTSADPAEILLLIIGCGAMDGSTVPQVDYIINIVYFVEFFDRNLT